MSVRNRVVQCVGRRKLISESFYDSDLPDFLISPTFSLKSTQGCDKSNLTLSIAADIYLTRMRKFPDFSAEDNEVVNVIAKMMRNVLGSRTH